MVTCKYLYVRIITKIHIKPAAITKPISNGVNRVWAWICSKIKEGCGVTTYLLAQSDLYTTPLTSNSPTSHTTAHHSRSQTRCI